MNEQTVDVREVLQRMGYTIHTETGTHFHMRPLYRDSDNNLALEVDKTTGLWFDFVERIGGPLSKLVEKTMKLSSEKVSEFFNDKSLSVTITDKYELGEVKQFDKILLLKLKKDHSYWVRRGISQHTVSTFEGGTTNNGRMKYRYVFPIFDNRKDLIGFSGRTLLDYPNVPKWKILGKKTNFLYPNCCDVGLYHQQSIIVESIGDMLSLAEIGIKHVIVSFGISISPTIIRFLLKCDCQKIIILLNNDADNESIGNRAAENICFSLQKFFDASQIRNIVPPEKDLNDFLMKNPDAFKSFCAQMELYV